MHNATHGNQVVVCVKILDGARSREMIPIVSKFLAVKCVSKRSEASGRGVTEEPIGGAVVFPAVVVPGADAATAQVGAGGFAEGTVVRKTLNGANYPNRRAGLAVRHSDGYVPNSLDAVAVLSKGYIGGGQSQRDAANAKNSRPHVQSPSKW